MFRVASLLVMTAVFANVSQGTPRPILMEQLTVPSAGLPPGCVIAPDRVGSPENPSGERNWAALNIPANPWVGTDALLIAAVRERMGPPPLMPDGPPLVGRERAAYRLRLADGIDEAYAAIYATSPSARNANIVVVYAVRYADPASAHIQLTPREAANPRIAGFTIGAIDVVIHGDGGPCFHSVKAHVKAIADAAR
jgi:hypothetical protein